MVAPRKRTTHQGGSRGGAAAVTAPVAVCASEVLHGCGGDDHDTDPRVRYEIWVSCDDCVDVVVARVVRALIRGSGHVTLASPCVQCGRRSVTPLADTTSGV